MNTSTRASFATHLVDMSNRSLLLKPLACTKTVPSKISPTSSAGMVLRAIALSRETPVPLERTLILKAFVDVGLSIESAEGALDTMTKDGLFEQDGFGRVKLTRLGKELGEFLEQVEAGVMYETRVRMAE